MAIASTDSLIGRAREVAVLRGLVTELQRGAGATMFVEGEAGIGNSRLLTTLIDVARESGVTVFRGEAHVHLAAATRGTRAAAPGLVGMRRA